MRVIWVERALDDLERIHDYIQSDNPAAAQRVIQRLRSGLESLSRFPRMGRAGRVSDTREFVFTDIPYIGVYRILEDEIEVLNIIHTARDYPPKA
ncbi:MAG TPA: type II toxin-antitoxin system RelE/ParE family toxin [Rhizomicrobium sp.]|nr:type II toxin-antitoxin system RelE/ParE family toxin [Rhizomicrobium sp.]